MKFHSNKAEEIAANYTTSGDHAASNYFPLIKELVKQRNESGGGGWQEDIDYVYSLVSDEIRTNTLAPCTAIKFGTSGWRGILGKDVNVRTVGCVTSAIVKMYMQAESDLLVHLGVKGFDDACARGCVVGHDNRFAGPVLARVVARVLSDAGFKVYFAGETTTGVLSAAVLELGAAFSVNLTPSHNPLEYGGYKFNAADAGPASPEVTGAITRLANELIESGYVFSDLQVLTEDIFDWQGVQPLDSLMCWTDLVKKNRAVHGLDLNDVMERFAANKDIVVVIDSVHGASRLHIPELMPQAASARCFTLRDSADVTFGGIAPEPSSVNMQGVVNTLKNRSERLKLGAIIDPDGDRIRFTDGETEISMNQFGAMAYHFLVKYKKKKGMVAKTVATSNMANSLADAFGEKLFEPKVGFKEFKPVMGEALVFFEESDGISIIGHTPEKDAYIGLLLALDMVLTTDRNLGDYKREIEQEFGAYFPDRDGVTVSVQGDQLMEKLKDLEKYGTGTFIEIGGVEKRIASVIDIDGRKMILDDGSWLMIRPSGTEPKVRFYVESRTESGTADLVDTARRLLADIGLL